MKALDNLILPLLVLGLLGTPSLGLAEDDGIAPKAETIDEYMQQLKEGQFKEDGYLPLREGQVNERMKQLEGQLDELLGEHLTPQHLEGQPQPVTEVQALSPYDRGASPGDVFENYLEVQHYLLEKFFGECGAHTMTFGPKGMCFKIEEDLLGFTHIYPAFVREYYFPFQMMETVETPFTTGFIPKKTVRRWQWPSEDLLDRFMRGLQVDNPYRPFHRMFMEDLYPRSVKRKWGIVPPKDVDDWSLDAISEWSIDAVDLRLRDKRFRPGQHSSEGHQAMEFHLLTSSFDEMFGGPLSRLPVVEPDGRLYDNGITCHESLEKDPPWFSEAKISGPVFPGKALFYENGMPKLNPGPIWSRFGFRSFDSASGDVCRPYLSEETMHPSGDEAGNTCREKRFESHTPQDILTRVYIPDFKQLAADMAHSLRGTNDDRYCLDGMNGPKGPFTNIVKSKYFAQAALVGHFRALRLGDARGSARGNKPGLFGSTPVWHPLQEVYNPACYGRRPRDRYSQLHPKQRLPRGNSCSAWDQEHRFTPDWFAADSIVANRNWAMPNNEELKWREWGNWWVGFHWRHIRCCPEGYSLISLVPGGSEHRW